MATRADSPAIRVSMEVEYRPAWLTWVAATTTCLQALGVEGDQADVAGFSGYAFHLGIHEEVCPSGPTVLDWTRLSRGVHSLGRATIELRSPCGEESGRAREESCRAALELPSLPLTRSMRPLDFWPRPGTLSPGPWTS